MSESLNDRMSFDQVVEIADDGEVIDRSDLYAPELFDGEVGSGWTLLNGFSGQDRYPGPIMHASEFIGGGMERYILANPGVYVALVDYASDDSEPVGWAVAVKDAS